MTRIRKHTRPILLSRPSAEIAFENIRAPLIQRTWRKLARFAKAKTRPARNFIRKMSSGPGIMADAARGAVTGAAIGSTPGLVSGAMLATGHPLLAAMPGAVIGAPIGAAIGSVAGVAKGLYNKIPAVKKASLNQTLDRIAQKKLTPIRMSSKLRRIQFISQEQRDILESAKHMGASAGITGAVGGTALSLLGKSTEEVAPLGKWAATKRAIKTGGKAGLGLGAAGVIASLTGAALLGRPRKGDKAVATKQGAIGGAVVGAGAGALIGAMARRPGAAKNFIDRQALHWKPVEAIQKGGLAKRLTIGSLAGGVFGAGHMADEGQQVDTLRNLKREKRMSSKLRPIQFGPSNEVFTSQGLTGKLAKDRYIKKIKDDDLDRRDANILRSAAAGAATGGLLRGRKGAAIGAGAGLASVLGIRAATASGRDAYGERSREGKSAESMPWKAGALAAAGLGAQRVNRKLNSMKITAGRIGRNVKIGAGLAGGAWLANKLFFGSRQRLIRFAESGVMSRRLLAGTAYDSDLGREVQRAATAKVPGGSGYIYDPVEVPGKPGMAATRTEAGQRPKKSSDLRDKEAFKKTLAKVMIAKHDPGLPERLEIAKRQDRDAVTAAKASGAKRISAKVKSGNQKAVMANSPVPNIVTNKKGVDSALRRTRKQIADNTRIQRKLLKGLREQRSGTPAAPRSNFLGYKKEGGVRVPIGEAPVKGTGFEGYKTQKGEQAALRDARAKYDKQASKNLGGELSRIKTKASSKAEALRRKLINANTPEQVVKHYGGVGAFGRTPDPALYGEAKKLATARAGAIIDALTNPVVSPSGGGADPFGTAADQAGFKSRRDALRWNRAYQHDVSPTGVDAVKRAKYRTLGGKVVDDAAVKAAVGKMPRVSIGTGTRTLKGLGIAAAIGAGGYGALKLSDIRRRKEEDQKLLMSSRTRLIRFGGKRKFAEEIGGKVVNASNWKANKLAERLLRQSEARAAQAEPASPEALAALAAKFKREPTVRVTPFASKKARGAAQKGAAQAKGAIPSRPDTRPRKDGAAAPKGRREARPDSVWHDRIVPALEQNAVADLPTAIRKRAIQVHRDNKSLNRLNIDLRTVNNDLRRKLHAGTADLEGKLASANKGVVERDNALRSISQTNAADKAAALEQQAGKMGAEHSSQMESEKTRRYRNTAIAGALGLAGGVAIAPRDNDKKKTMKLTSKLRAIRFASETYEEGVLRKADERREWRGANSMAKKAQTYVKRGKALTQDVIRAAKGQKNLDSRGRERRREWDKPWVRSALATSIMAGTAVLGHRIYKGTAASTSIGQIRAMKESGELAANMRFKYPRSAKVIDKVRSWMPGATNEGAGVVERGPAKKFVDMMHETTAARKAAGGAAEKVEAISESAAAKEAKRIAQAEKERLSKIIPMSARQKLIQFISDDSMLEERVTGDRVELKGVRRRKPRPTKNRVMESEDWSGVRNTAKMSGAFLAGLTIPSVLRGGIIGSATGPTSGGGAARAEEAVIGALKKAAKKTATMRASAIIPADSIVRLSSRLDALIG